MVQDLLPPAIRRRKGHTLDRSLVHCRAALERQTQLSTHALTYFQLHLVFMSLDCGRNLENLENLDNLENLENLEETGRRCRFHPARTQARCWGC